jgi:ERCC4-related helicase
MDIQKDPYVLKLKAEPQSSWKLGKLLLSGKTYCVEQLNKFYSKARHIYDELGQWAADYFIAESIRKLQKMVDTNEEISFGLENDEKAYLLGILTKVPRTELVSDLRTVDSLQISAKVDSLISFLAKEEHDKFSGLIFVRQRATVSVMTKLLSIHPKTRDRFRCAPYVGLSNSANRKQNIGELLDPRDQCETLDNFRQGRTNLIIATDVLEEGIDVTACHLVICFNKPPNLKSFIQRRGRARQEKSTFVIMLADDDVSASLNSWQALEGEMLRVFQNDARLLQEVSSLESIQEDIEDEFRVESTG